MTQLFKYFLLSTLLILTGCGLNPVQKEGVSRFAKASGGLGEFSAVSLSQYREATIEMNTLDNIIRSQVKTVDLDESFDVEDIAARISAATALTSYGRLLMALVENTQEAELKDASDEFVDSFRNVSGKKLNDDQLESLGILVQRLGGLFVEYKKAKAVKKIVLDTEKDVDLLCDLLIADFSRSDLGLMQGFDDTIKRLKVDADIALAEATGQGERELAMGAYRMAVSNEAKLNTVITQAVQTLNALKKANSQLAAALREDSNSISDIRAMGAEFKELSDAIRVFAGQ
ncbi:MAG: hypothetical protein ACU833_14390 [Gammaproteobacteria bacterium]